MSTTVIFYALAALGLYTLVVAWWREAQANALVVPLVLSSLQLVVVFVATYVTDVAGHPGGPTGPKLVLVFVQGGLPLSLVQTFLTGRRKPQVFSKLNVSWPLSLVLGRKGWGWLMVLVMAQLALGTANTSEGRAVDIAALALQVATVGAMVLIQTNRIGPRPPNPVTQTFD